ncbi:MAG: hypothetical protein BGO90_14615 [Legionella sp. 40-6]|nr:MAG: hypothetical protein BGO90_14615 [Legionella sp. 40-6]
MKTNNFFSKFLSNNRIVPELEQVYHHVYFKGHGNRYTATNNLMSEFVGYSQEQLKELTDREIVIDSVSYNHISNNDRTIVNDQTIKVFYEYCTSKRQSENFLSIKAPFYDENQIIGVCGISVAINAIDFSGFNNIISIINSLFEEDIDKKSIEKAVCRRRELTVRELECLRLYMKGGSAKSIAKVLSLSPRTIEDHLENTKSKFGVNRRSELLELAFKNYPELISE